MDGRFYCHYNGNEGDDVQYWVRTTNAHSYKPCSLFTDARSRVYPKYDTFIYIMYVPSLWLVFYLDRHTRFEEESVIKLYHFRTNTCGICRSSIDYILIWLCVFSATFNNTWSISWRSVLLWRKPGLAGETTHPLQVLLGGVEVMIEL